MNILGINAYHGNASAALVCDGRLVAAVEEERFNRVKYAAGFPVAAIRYCLAGSGDHASRKWTTSPCREIPGRAWAPSCYMRCACRASRGNAPRC